LPGNTTAAAPEIKYLVVFVGRHFVAKGQAAIGVLEKPKIFDADGTTKFDARDRQRQVWFPSESVFAGHH
jgi:hypothetical protein